MNSTREAVTAERAFLSGLGGGCALPVAAFAEAGFMHPATFIRLTGLVISEDGKRIVKVVGQGSNAVSLGNDLAREAVAQGASEILVKSSVK